MVESITRILGVGISGGKKESKKKMYRNQCAYAFEVKLCFHGA